MPAQTQYCPESVSCHCSYVYNIQLMILTINTHVFEFLGIALENLAAIFNPVLSSRTIRICIQSVKKTVKSCLRITEEKNKQLVSQGFSEMKEQVIDDKSHLDLSPKM